MDKKLLTASQQIEFLKKEKGLTFNLIDERDAEYFLENKIFLFKLKAFCKNYEKYHASEDKKGKYLSLDFGELVELSRLDKIFRDEILNLTLDLEHYLKVRINRGAMACGVDPYALAELFIEKSRLSAIQQQKEKLDYGESVRLIGEAAEVCARISSDSSIGEIIDIANLVYTNMGNVLHGINPNHIANSLNGMLNSPYSSGLANKYKDKTPPYWCLAELMTFGSTISFYKMCFAKDGPLSDDSDEVQTCKGVKNLLRSAQILRNAAAHNDCLLNSLRVRQKTSSRTGIVKILEQYYEINPAYLNPVKRNPLLVDFSALLVAYDVIVPSGQSRAKAQDGLIRMKRRFLENIRFFQDEEGVIKTASLRDFFAYSDNLLEVFIMRLEENPLVLEQRTAD